MSLTRIGIMTNLAGSFKLMTSQLFGALNESCFTVDINIACTIRLNAYQC